MLGMNRHRRRVSTEELCIVLDQHIGAGRRGVHRATQRCLGHVDVDWVREEPFEKTGIGRRVLASRNGTLRRCT